MTEYRRRSAQVVCLFCLTLGITTSLWAQQGENPQPEQERLENLDVTKFNKRSPLSTAQGFMRAAELGDYETAAEFLDLRYLPKELSLSDGPRLAEQLYIVFSRSLRIDFGALSSDPLGLADDGLPSFRDSLGKIMSSSSERQIYLQRVPGAGDEMLWKISNASVALVPELYAEYGYSPLLERVRDITPQGSFLGAEFFKWILSLLSGIAAALAWLIIAWPLSKILTRRNEGNTSRVKSYLTRPITAAVFVIVGGVVLRDLGLGVTATKFADSGTPVTIVIVWLLFATVNLFRDLYANFLASRGRESGFMLLGPVSSTIKVFVALIALTFWLNKVGVEVTALIAGLGVGGIAVALVLQRPLEDILGAFTLYTQQPVMIGQFCTSGDVTGTIDEHRAIRADKYNGLGWIPGDIREDKLGHR